MCFNPISGPIQGGFCMILGSKHDEHLNFSSVLKVDFVRQNWEKLWFEMV